MYNDPSGHCATTQEDYKDCIRLGHKVRNLWQYDGSGYFDAIFIGGMLDFQNSDDFLGSQTDAWMFEQIISGYQGNEDSAYYGHYVRDVIPYKEQQAAIAAERSKNAAARRASNQRYNAGRERICTEVWDCRAMGYDMGSFGLSLAGDALVACTLPSGGLCGPAAVAVKLADLSLTAESVRYTTAQHANGKASDADLAVTLVTSSSSLLWGGGEVASAVSFIWNLFDPIIPDDN